MPLVEYCQFTSSTYLRSQILPHREDERLLGLYSQRSHTALGHTAPHTRYVSTHCHQPHHVTTPQHTARPTDVVRSDVKAVAAGARGGRAADDSQLLHLSGNGEGEAEPRVEQGGGVWGTKRTK